MGQMQLGHGLGSASGLPHMESGALPGCRRSDVYFFEQLADEAA